MEEEPVVEQLYQTSRCCRVRHRSYEWYSDLVHRVEAISSSFPLSDIDAIRSILRDKGSWDLNRRKTHILYRHLILRRARDIFFIDSPDRYSIRSGSVVDGQKIRFVRDYYVRCSDSRIYFIPSERKNVYDYVRTDFGESSISRNDYYKLIGMDSWKSKF